MNFKTVDISLSFVIITQKGDLMKRIIFFILLIILIMTASVSCVSNSNKSGRTKVVFWHVMGGPTGEALKELIDTFNAGHPDIEVVPISVGNYNALSQKIMASSSNPPVISQMYESWTSELYAAGLLSPVENFIDDDYRKELENDMFRIFIEDNTFNGTLVSLPFNKSVPTYFYNKDMDFVIEPGEFKIMVGNSSENILLNEKINVEGDSIRKIGCKKRKFLSTATIS